jgi:CheY-like chemotaxis protein
MGVDAAMILVVDDCSDVREIVCLALEQGGFEAAGASNGEEAMTWLRRKTAPTAILLDLMMPIMNGYQFLKAKAAEPHLARVPVVLMTAVQSYSLFVLGYQIVDCLPKPFSTSALLAAVERTAWFVTG